LAKSVTVE